MLTKTKPYNHQILAYNQLFDKEYGALFAEQGTGKSKISIDIACNLFNEGKIKQVLLITPDGIKKQWRDEQIPLHSSHPWHCFMWQSSKTNNAYIKEKSVFFDKPIFGGMDVMLKWLIVNIDVFSSSNYVEIFKDYCKKAPTLIIIDEATRIKNPNANRTFNLTYGLTNNIKQGKTLKVINHLAKYRLILTGTMITNSPFDLYGMFTFLNHKFFNCNYHAFKAKYGLMIRETNNRGQEYTRMMKPEELKSVRKYLNEGKSELEITLMMSTFESAVRYVKEHPDKIDSPYKHLDELKAQIAPYSFITTKKECLDLPEKVYMKLEVEMTPVQKRLYKELVNEYLTKYNDQELNVTNKLALTIRLRQIIGGFFPSKTENEVVHTVLQGGNPKLQALLEDLEDTGQEQIVIWCSFVAELKVVYEALKSYFKDVKTIALYYGGTSQEDREEIIDRFKAGEIQILVANSQTAGYGLNLQNSSLHYYYSNDYSLERRLQSEDRSHRLGQTETCVYKDIIMKGTIDEKIVEILRQKKNLLDYFRDNSLRSILLNELKAEA